MAAIQLMANGVSSAIYSAYISHNNINVSSMAYFNGWQYGSAGQLASLSG
jgi:hypothetical protein